MSREKCAENMISVLPYVFMKFKNVYHVADMPKQQLQLLFKISKNDGEPLSVYGDMLMIPKSNITVASNSLVEAGLVVRDYSPTDRRIILLRITEKGKEYLDIYMKQVKKAMVERLKAYEDEDIERISNLVEELKEIIEKVND